MFSTTIGCPSVRETPSLNSRAMTSVAAPGPVGTINLTGRCGQDCDEVCAWVSAASTSIVQQISARRRTITADTPFRLQSGAHHVQISLPSATATIIAIR